MASGECHSTSPYWESLNVNVRLCSQRLASFSAQSFAAQDREYFQGINDNCELFCWLLNYLVERAVA